MGKKPLIWAFLFALLLGISPLVYARIHFPFFWHRHKVVTESTQMPSELARADMSAGTSPYQLGWNTGYKSGYEGGQADHSKSAKFDKDDAPGYKSGHSFCESLEGKAEHQCRKGYRVGFDSGYRDGYKGLQSRLAVPQEAAPSQAAAPPVQSPSEPEIQNQPEQPSTAMQETPQETPPQPSTTEQVRNEPRALPKTGSSLPLFGLIGLTGIALSLLSRALRKITET